MRRPTKFLGIALIIAIGLLLFPLVHAKTVRTPKAAKGGQGGVHLHHRR